MPLSPEVFTQFADPAASPEAQGQPANPTEQALRDFNGQVGDYAVPSLQMLNDIELTLRGVTETAPGSGEYHDASGATVDAATVQEATQKGDPFARMLTGEAAQRNVEVRAAGSPSDLGDQNRQALINFGKDPSNAGKNLAELFADYKAVEDQRGALSDQLITLAGGTPTPVNPNATGNGDPTQLTDDTVVMAPVAVEPAPVRPPIALAPAPTTGKAKQPKRKKPEMRTAAQMRALTGADTRSAETTDALLAEELRDLTPAARAEAVARLREQGTIKAPEPPKPLRRLRIVRDGDGPENTPPTPDNEEESTPQRPFLEGVRLSNWQLGETDDSEETEAQATEHRRFRRLGQLALRPFNRFRRSKTESEPEEVAEHEPEETRSFVEDVHLSDWQLGEEPSKPETESEPESAADADNEEPRVSRREAVRRRLHTVRERLGDLAMRGLDLVDPTAPTRTGRTVNNMDAAAQQVAAANAAAAARTTTTSKRKGRRRAA
jgi:hypothetical protein